MISETAKIVIYDALDAQEHAFQAWLVALLTTDQEREHVRRKLKLLEATRKELEMEPPHDVVVRTADQLPEITARDALVHLHPGVFYHQRLRVHFVVLDEIDPSKLARTLIETQRELGLTRERLAKLEKQLRAEYETRPMGLDGPDGEDPYPGRDA